MGKGKGGSWGNDLIVEERREGVNDYIYVVLVDVVGEGREGKATTASADVPSLSP